jgi:phage host-nuclease inhibitor protein Gam
VTNFDHTARRYHKAGQSPKGKYMSALNTHNTRIAALSPLFDLFQINDFEAQYQAVDARAKEMDDAGADYESAPIETTVDDTDQAEAHLRALRYWRTQADQIEAHAKAQVEQVERWKRQELAKITPRIHFHESGLVAFLSRSGKKTLSLINGTLKRIAGRDRVEVKDADMLIDWANRNFAGNLLRTKIEADKVAILNHIKATGEVPEGVDMVTGEDTFKIATE